MGERKEKRKERRKKKFRETFQEMQEMGKKFIEGYFPEKEKHGWLNKLEMIRLQVEGTELLEKKEHEEAIKYFQEALDLNPNDPNSRMVLNMAHEVLREKDKKKALKGLHEIRMLTSRMIGDLQKYIMHELKPDFNIDKSGRLP